jgi:hypothetical protein
VANDQRIVLRTRVEFALTEADAHELLGALTRCGVSSGIASTFAKTLAAELEAGSLSPDDAVKLANAISRGGSGGMAFAITLATAIADASAGRTPDVVEVSGMKLSAVGAALEQAGTLSSKELERLLSLISISHPHHRP